MKEVDLKKQLPEFRNLRDVSQYSKPNIKSDMLFRSSDLSAYENDPLLSQWLNQHRITTIIDLRNRRDIIRRTYSSNVLKIINYRNIALVSEETEARIVGRDNIEYYSWVLMNEDENIKEIFTILSEKKNYPLIIHCHVGMDRTGIVFALIHLLLDSPGEKMIDDYLASGSNMKLELITRILQIIDDHGGIVQYLRTIGISTELQTQIIGILTK
ncbi:MAG: tyrosine-protein phosphatase [Candidatus Hodarchaeales archaeon]|jgi:protein-tyrosine phosphatase